MTPISYTIPGVGVRPGTDKKKQPTKGLMRSASDPSSTDLNNNVGFYFATSENRNKELQTNQGPELIDPDGSYDEHLDAMGVTIIKSETYYPQSRTTITKRSMTPEEHAAEREYSYYLER